MVATTLRMARAGAAHSSQYMYARGRLTAPGRSQPLRQHAQHQAWYSAVAGVGGGAAGVPDSSARPDLVEAVAVLLVSQPSISVRDATKALKQSHPEQWQQATGGGWGSKDVRLAIKQLRDSGHSAGRAPLESTSASVTWSADPWGDAEQQRRDATAGFVVSKDFVPFNQKNDIFCRSFWDDSIRSKRTQQFWQGFAPFSLGGEPWKGRQPDSGFGQVDYALRNAAWHVMDTLAELKEHEDRREGFLDPFTILNDGPPTYNGTSSANAAGVVDFGTPSEASGLVKQVAELFGADDVGITGRDDRWHYTASYSRQHGREKPGPFVPEGLPHAIIIVTAMDGRLLQTVPSALSEAAAGLGYGWDSVVLLSLAQFLRNAGYQAVPSLNDTALAIPYAVQAGLGEYGRHGLLIHPHYGPRVRIGKLWTDLPLSHDEPAPFGVADFCEICDRCATACPAQAISYGPRHKPISTAATSAAAAKRRRGPVTGSASAAGSNTDAAMDTAAGNGPCSSDVTGAASAGAASGVEHHNVSNLVGVSKWTTNAEKCFSYWTQSNAACSVCIRVCPYNRVSDGDGSTDKATTLLQRLSDQAWRKLASSAVARGLCQRLALIWDDASGRSERLRPTAWWRRHQQQQQPK